jgi:hypothetical protein
MKLGQSFLYFVESFSPAEPLSYATDEGSDPKVNKKVLPGDPCSPEHFEN